MRAGDATVYKGRSGQWAFVAHRTTGFLVFMFLLLHIIDVSLVNANVELYDEVHALYGNVLLRLFECGLLLALLFHSLNGLRIIAVDFWAKGTRFQKPLLWATVAVWAVIMIPATYFMTLHTIQALFGSVS